MPIMRSAVLCGSHSGDLVPDLHGPVPESGDIEILDTHVSYCDGQPDPSMGSYSCDQGYTAIWLEKDTKHTSPNSRVSINPKQFTTSHYLQHEQKYTQAIIQACNMISSCINNAGKTTFYIATNETIRVSSLAVWLRAEHCTISR